LGDGSTTRRLTPTRIGTGTGWVAVAGSGYHSLALETEGSLWAWGQNVDGQLGDGTTTERHIPTRIGTGAGWVAVATGFAHSLALQADGSLWAWGCNDCGQLGDGSTADRDAPTRIGTGTGWVAVAAGYEHSLALKAGGALWAWGENDYGQLGDGTTTERHDPTQVLAGTFRPDNSVTRQQFAKMIVKALGLTVTGAEICPFTDVVAQTGTDPFYPSKYVAVCATNGITTGKTATAFAPADNITRQQLITMVARATKPADPPAGYAPDFSPGQFSLDEHYQNARKAAYAGLLDGLQGVGPTYNFLAASTRGECAQVLYNLTTLP
jgi:hypothetical protein